jgi:hypothetical protein
MISLQFMVGTSGLDNSQKLSANWMEQGGAERKFQEVTGDAGVMLLEGLDQRIARGSFGDWASDMTSEHHHGTIGMLFANTAAPDDLVAFAKHEGADVLIALEATSKSGGAVAPRRRGANRDQQRGQAFSLVVRVVDVANDSELWVSEPISSAQIADGRAKGADPGVRVVNDLLTYLDESLILEPLPEMTPPAALKDAQETAASKSGNFLLRIATIRAYQCRGWITADEAFNCYATLLDRSRAEQLARGTPDDRAHAIVGLIPKHR